MKFVSPDQRGTTWRWTWSAMPAPATRPRFQPRLNPSGAVDARQHVDGGDGEAMDLERLVVRELGERTDVAPWGDHEMPGRVRVLVQERDRRLAVVDAERLVRRERACRLVAEDAAVLLVGLRDVLEPPRCPEGLRHAPFLPPLASPAARARRLQAMSYALKLAGAAIGFLLLGVLGILIFDAHLVPGRARRGDRDRLRRASLLRLEIGPQGEGSTRRARRAAARLTRDGTSALVSSCSSALAGCSRTSERVDDARRATVARVGDGDTLDVRSGNARPARADRRARARGRRVLRA